MRYSFARVPCLLAALSLVVFTPLFSKAQSPPRLRVEWNYPRMADIVFRINAGPSSRNYTTNWNLDPVLRLQETNMQAVLDLSRLSIGTNYITLQAETIQNTNGNVVGISDYSNEVTIWKLPPPVIRIGVTFEVSTNLTAWTDLEGKEAYALLSADGSLQYFRPRSQKIELVVAAPPATADESDIEATTNPVLTPPTP